jgi:hypothetical protein
MEPINFECQYGETDFSAVAGYVARRLFKKTIPTIAWSSILLAILFAWWLAGGDIGFATGFVLGCFFIVVGQHFRTKRLITKAWKLNPQFHERWKADLSEQALTMQGATFGVKRLWHNFQTYQELDDHFLLFQAENPAIWLPKRAFCDKVDVVRNLIASKLPPKG